jgi:hypothetical protein
MRRQAGRDQEERSRDRPESAPQRPPRRSLRSRLRLRDRHDARVSTQTAANEVSVELPHGGTEVVAESREDLTRGGKISENKHSRSFEPFAVFAAGG